MKLISVLWMLGGLLFSQLLCADDSSVEYKIKAGYLYNFTKFINWSTDHAETFNLCIAGDDPFGELIDPIEKLSVMGRPIKVFRFDSLKKMDKEPHCHILFVSSSIKDKLIVRSFDDTLLVGESGEFIEQGGMIGFVNKQDKIKLQINLKTITQSGLKVSAKLLEVADVVKGINND
ncbi:MAG: YfiR family protein [Methylococcaceae bacterium]